MRIIKYSFLVTILLISAVTINFSCKKSSASLGTYTTDKTALQHAIDSLTTVYNNATEGTKPGDYAVGAKAKLDTAIVLAGEVNASDHYTQYQVNNTVYNLLQAGIVFQNYLIQQVASDNLVAYWTFSGNTNDSSGNGHNGILSTNYIGASGAAVDGGTLPQLTEDRFGNKNMAYHFTKGATIEVPYSTAFVPQNFTITAWIKMDSNVNAANYFFSLDRWEGYKFNIQGSNYLLFTMNTSGSGIVDNDDGSSIPVNQWVFVAVSYSSGSLKFYMNDKLTATKTTVTGALVAPNPTMNLTIGNEMPKSAYDLTNTSSANYYWGSDAFWGSIDDVRFYNTQLTDAQILSIYTVENTQ